MKKFIAIVMLAVITVSNTFAITVVDDNTFTFRYNEIQKGYVAGHRISGYDVEAQIMLQKIINVIQTPSDYRNGNVNCVTFTAHIQADGTVKITL